MRNDRRRRGAMVCHARLETQKCPATGLQDAAATLPRHLLFVRATRAQLDPIVSGTATLQYRYKLGAQHTPIVVRSTDMERFINAVRSASGTQYFRPDEITPAMTRRPIRIIGGRLDGYTGTLVTTRGSKAKRLLVELPGFLAAAVEVEAEYIQLLPARKD